MSRELKYNSRAFSHLGKDLITSPEVAVVELIKNSFDARSEKAYIHIYENLDQFKPKDLLTEMFYDITTLFPKELNSLSFTIFEDIGIGMNDETIDKGFLVVGTDIKKAQRNQESIILGEKGIGRLSTQRLGDVLIVETKSEEEDFINIFIIDWKQIINSSFVGKYDIPDKKIPNKNINSYTRLWILNSNLNNYFVNYIEQLPFSNPIPPSLTPELETALSFLVSPFVKNEKDIQVFFNGLSIRQKFNDNVFKVAETIHQFNFNCDNDDSVNLNVKLCVTPWFLKRIYYAHQATSEKLKINVNENKELDDNYFINLFKKYEYRFTDSLQDSYTIDELSDRIYKLRESFKPKSLQNNSLQQNALKEYLLKQIRNYLQELTNTIPIYGTVFSYKRDAKYGELIFDFAKSYALSLNQNDGIKDFTFSEFKQLLKQNDGIKLYRSKYRIGFLGNKESDWIYLQQYRTSGQQYYRFNSANTIGFVSINDLEQKYIQEISSRLDINKNPISDVFRDLVNYIFNYSFYEFNRRADQIAKDILTIENLLPSVTTMIKDKDKIIHNLLKTASKTSKRIEKTVSDLNKEKITNDDIVSAKETLSSAKEQIDNASEVLIETSNIIKETHQELKILELESFNNFKLMANGLITETITHELHSICSNTTTASLDKDLEVISDYLLDNNVKLYNSSYRKIEGNYKTLVGKVESIGELYSFVDNTFIRKNDYSFPVLENIELVVNLVSQKLKNKLNESHIEIAKENLNTNWLFPRGVLLHVFYNLIDNSIYWIDQRKKRALTDKLYQETEDIDHIHIQAHGDDKIIIWDTGTGVLNNMQHILFHPLETGKTDGRGMGLYIVQQLLNSFGYDIMLLDEKNKYGNRYIFSIFKQEEQ